MSPPRQTATRREEITDARAERTGEEDVVDEADVEVRVGSRHRRLEYHDLFYDYAAFFLIKSSTIGG